MSNTDKTSKILKIVFILLAIIIILQFPVSQPPNGSDFQAYWSSAYLFSRGMDFSNTDALDKVERTLTNWDGDVTLYAWFSPIGNVLLFPFTFLPFAKAFYFWLIFNIGILFYSTILIWGNSQNRLWIPLLVVFGFSMTVVSLAIGQINLIGMAGLAMFSSFNKQSRPYLAGASLILTIIKPQLVILTLPILLLDLLRRKQWAVLIGLASAFTFCLFFLFAVYPPWFQSFLNVIMSGIANFRETPNINGLLVHLGKPTIGRIIWFIALLSAVIWWWKKGHNWNQRTFVDISVTVGLIISPIGWSYDQIILLFPILSISSWIANNELPKNNSWFIILALVTANLLSYYQRTLILSDLWFFWIPLLILVLYLAALKKRNKILSAQL